MTQPAQSSGHEWRQISDWTPKQGEVVETKIDDSRGCRNETKLYRQGNLWFIPDGSMYVYYTPTHWRAASVAQAAQPPVSDSFSNFDCGTCGAHLCPHGNCRECSRCFICEPEAAQPQEVPAPLTPFGEELQQKSFRDGVRSLRLLVREEMDKPNHVMPHAHNPDVQPEHQREYCWRCKIERVLDSKIEGYKVHCSREAQEVPAEQREPDGWAYRYPSLSFGGAQTTVIRFETGGREINGSKPIEAIPYYLGSVPTQPASAAKPPFTIQSHPDPLGRTMCTADAIARHGEFHTHELAPETPPEAQGIHAPAGSVQESSQTAKPAEDGLEAKIRAILKESVEACWKIKARGDDEVLGAFSRDVAAFIRTHQAARAGASWNLVNELEREIGRLNKEIHDWVFEFNMYRGAWLREIGGTIRRKTHEIDGFVLRTRDVIAEAEKRGTAARERELLEKLEGLAAKWDSSDYAIAEVSNPLVPQEQCAIEVRALIATQRGK